MTFNNLKTNSRKLAHYRLKIRKVIEFFEFLSLTQRFLYANEVLRMRVYKIWMSETI